MALTTTPLSPQQRRDTTMTATPGTDTSTRVTTITQHSHNAGTTLPRRQKPCNRPRPGLARQHRAKPYSSPSLGASSPRVRARCRGMYRQGVYAHTKAPGRAGYVRLQAGHQLPHLSPGLSHTPTRSRTLRPVLTCGPGAARQLTPLSRRRGWRCWVTWFIDPWCWGADGCWGVAEP